MKGNGGMVVSLWILGGLCVASFLNMLGYRLLVGKRLLTKRSHCPFCEKVIAWHDLIPLVSFIVLRGRCRLCSQAISPIYFFIELVGAGAGAALWYDAFMYVTPDPLFWWLRSALYILFIAGFVLAMRTDLQALVVPRVVLAYMLCIALIGVGTESLGITTFASFSGGLLGYGSLWLLNRLALWLTGRQGIGEGDMDLLGLIGLMWGPIGVWIIAFMSSLLGIVCTGLYLLVTGQGRHTRIPFIPFMGVASILYVAFQEPLVQWLLG